MGALTLKSFPFELRGWDIENFESLDPTDGFGSSTRVYVSKDQIVQIEPDFDYFSQNTWITDKGRQFFDSIFGKWDFNKNEKINDLSITKKEWSKIFKSIILNLYILDHCNKNLNQNKSFTIVFENLSIEVLSLLQAISYNYSFIKVRRAENLKLNNDLETAFQLNTVSNKLQLNDSTFCLILSTNTRYEGSFLNLNLRQRMLKGNFKCFILGSLIDLTFPTSFLGSNLKNLKTLVEGNNVICQDIKTSKNPTFIINTEIFKRKDSNAIMNMLKVLNHSNILNKNWYSLNTLNPSISESSNHFVSNFMPVTESDLNNYNTLYFLNVSSSNINNLNKIIDSKLIGLFKNTNLEVKNSNKLFIDQNYNLNKNGSFLKKLQSVDGNLNKNIQISNNMFYENSETFLTTEGRLKKSTKLIFKKRNKSTWQILRRFLKILNNQTCFLDNKTNNILNFNSNKLMDFRNYISFQYYATNSLTNLNFHLIQKTNAFDLKHTNFKKQTNKYHNTKINYWLNDFFLGGKDSYSHDSLILANCSKIQRSEFTNFF